MRNLPQLPRVHRSCRLTIISHVDVIVNRDPSFLPHLVKLGRLIDIGDLPPLGRALQAAPAGERLEPGMTVDDVERRLIMLTLDHTGNNKTRAAELLGISLKTLHNKLNRFRLDDAGSAG